MRERFIPFLKNKQMQETTQSSTHPDQLEQTINVTGKKSQAGNKISLGTGSTGALNS